MKIKAYSVLDRTAGNYATPFFAPNDEVAKRNFRFSLKRLDEMFVADLVLYCIGDFDNESGTFSTLGDHLVDSGIDVLSEREIEKKNSEVKQ